MHDIHSFRVRRLKAIHIVSALIFFEKYVPQNMPNGCNDGPFLPDMKCRPHSCTAQQPFISSLARVMMITVLIVAKLL